MNEAPRVALTDTPLATTAAVGPVATLTPCTFGSVGPPNFQAAMTSAVRITIAVRAITTSRDSRCWAVVPALGRHPPRPQRMLLLARHVARVVLVNVQLAVHPERIGVGGEEALDVGVRGQLVEPLLLESAQVLRPHLGAELHFVEIEALTRAGLAKA